MAENKRLTKAEKEQVVEHGNEVLTEQKLARVLNEDSEKPKGLEIISELANLVDIGTMTMPSARKILGIWFNEQSDRAAVITEGKARIRRFKQISDALYEEFSALCSSQS